MEEVNLLLQEIHRRIKSIDLRLSVLEAGKQRRGMGEVRETPAESKEPVAPLQMLIEGDVDPKATNLDWTSTVKELRKPDGKLGRKESAKVFNAREAMGWEGDLESSAMAASCKIGNELGDGPFDVSAFQVPGVTDSDCFQKEGVQMVKSAKEPITHTFIFRDGVLITADSRAGMAGYISSQSVKKIIELNPYRLGAMVGGAVDWQFWHMELGTKCRLHEMTNILFSYRGLGSSVGTMIAGGDETSPGLYYMDSEEGRLKGTWFSVGFGSPYVYGVMDNGFRILGSKDEPPKEWPPPGGIMVRLGNPGYVESDRESSESYFSIGCWGGLNWGNKFPTPNEMWKGLVKFVIGRKRTKNVLSVAVYNHYQRIYHEYRHKLVGSRREAINSAGDDSVKLENHNNLLMGPIGFGKTLLAKTLTRSVNVPIVIADAITLIRVGYAREDVESILHKLHTTADYNVVAAQKGLSSGVTCLKMDKVDIGNIMKTEWEAERSNPSDEHQNSKVNGIGYIYHVTGKEIVDYDWENSNVAGVDSDKEVGMTKVKMDPMKPWIATRITELRGFEDEVLINIIFVLLDGKEVKVKKVQISRTGFRKKNIGKRTKELWAFLLSAQLNDNEVSQFLEANEEETRKKKVEAYRIAGEIRKKREKEGKDMDRGRVSETPALVADLYVGISLVDFYAKCGDMERAMKLFRRMPVQIVVSWTTIIFGFVTKDEFVSALELFKEMHMRMFLYATAVGATKGGYFMYWAELYGSQDNLTGRKSLWYELLLLVDNQVVTKVWGQWEDKDPISATWKFLFDIRTRKSNNGSKLKKSLKEGQAHSKNILTLKDRKKLPVAILDRKRVKQGNRADTKALVQWTGGDPMEATWECLFDLQEKCPDCTLGDKGAVEGKVLIQEINVTRDKEKISYEAVDSVTTDHFNNNADRQ